MDILPADTLSLTREITLSCDIEGTPSGTPARIYTTPFDVPVVLDVSR